MAIQQDEIHFSDVELKHHFLHSITNLSKVGCFGFNGAFNTIQVISCL